MKNDLFQRSMSVLGTDVMHRLATIRVIIFGVGGVGSWCAEALVRTGLIHLTIVDDDIVQESNVNRQLMATTQTIGRSKVEELRTRLLAINPDSDIKALHQRFTADTAREFQLEQYDYVVDAIDSLKDKASLLLMACDSPATVLSSMGAAMKTAPTRIRITEFWRVSGDPLARTLRRKFKQLQQFPSKKFLCVYSDEPPKTASPIIQHSTAVQGSTSNVPRSTTKGSLVQVTAVFGFMLASIIINDEQ